jgi:hypothetical protein
MFVPHAVSTAALVYPQVPLMQVRMWQVVSWPGHSEAVLQPTHAPWPLQYMPVPHAVFTVAFVDPQMPLLHVRDWQAVSCPGQSAPVRHCTQTPFAHSEPCGQTWAHCPQFTASPARVTQAVPHCAVPAGQVETQIPSEHICPPRHTFPQAPQIPTIGLQINALPVACRAPGGAVGSTAAGIADLPLRTSHSAPPAMFGVVGKIGARAFADRLGLRTRALLTGAPAFAHSGADLLRWAAASRARGVARFATGLLGSRRARRVQRIGDRRGGENPADPGDHLPARDRPFGQRPREAIEAGRAAHASTLIVDPLSHTVPIAADYNRERAAELFSKHSSREPDVESSGSTPT